MDSQTSRFLEGTLEDIRASFVTITHASQFQEEYGRHTELVVAESKQALQLLDSFELAAKSCFGQTMLPLEPVALSAVADEVMHILLPYAKKYNVRLELSLAGRYAPVMANAEALLLAVQHMGRALIEHAEEHDELIVGIHKTPGGIATGVFTTKEAVGLSAEGLRRGLSIVGRAKAPFATFTARAGSGLFVADSLLKSMHTRLRIGRHDKGWGLATTFQPSRQLALL